MKDAYGRNGFGQSVLLARRLVESGCRFVTAAGYDDAAWDTHSDNDKLHREKLVPWLDQALAFLLEDLHRRGLLESTVVIAMGEFGRTPQVNAKAGRDHWPHCWSMLLGGGGLQGGQVVGASDESAAPADQYNRFDRWILCELLDPVGDAFRDAWAQRAQVKPYPEGDPANALSPKKGKKKAAEK